MKEQHGRIGNLPANIDVMNPVPNKDAKTITGLVRKNGKVSGYELSDGRVLSKREGVALAKQGGIRGVPLPAAMAASICAPCPTAASPTTWAICPPPRKASNDAKIPWPVTRPGDFYRRFIRLENLTKGPITQPSSSASHSAPQRHFSALANSFSARSGKARSQAVVTNLAHDEVAVAGGRSLAVQRGRDSRPRQPGGDRSGSCSSSQRLRPSSLPPGRCPCRP